MKFAQQGHETLCQGISRSYILEEIKPH